MEGKAGKTGIPDELYCRLEESINARKMLQRETAEQDVSPKLKPAQKETTKQTA